MTHAGCFVSGYCLLHKHAKGGERVHSAGMGPCILFLRGGDRVKGNRHEIGFTIYGKHACDTRLFMFAGNHQRLINILLL